MEEIKDNSERGVVKVYFLLKEFGFITREKGKDLFFLRSSFEDEMQIEEGAIVDFLIKKTSVGGSDMAVEIKRVA